MNIALWVAQVLLAVAYLGSGVMKLVRSRAEIIASGSGNWAKDFSDSAVKGIGAVEVLGALGLVLPWATGIAPILTPIAAAGLVVVQLVATRVHLKINETKTLPVNVILLLLAAFVAIGRFAG
ncbi:DoxX family protein [Lentzea sp. NPDC058450]|uniref:DoxX family protein n=1 Tax=Lentzea sp. NPDC058450 TaxID=3346505 RepID=UPI00364FF80C